MILELTEPPTPPPCFLLGLPATLKYHGTAAILLLDFIVFLVIGIHKMYNLLSFQPLKLIISIFFGILKFAGVQLLENFCHVMGSYRLNRY